MVPARTPQYPLRLQPRSPGTRLPFSGVMVDYSPSPQSLRRKNCGMFPPTWGGNDLAPPSYSGQEWAEPRPGEWSELPDAYPGYPAVGSGCSETPPIHPSWAWCPGPPPRGWKAPPDFTTWWNEWRAPPESIAWWNSWKAPPCFVAWWNSWQRPQQQQQEHQHSGARTPSAHAVGSHTQRFPNTSPYSRASSSAIDYSGHRTPQQSTRPALSQQNTFTATGGRIRSASADPRKTVRRRTSVATLKRPEFCARSPNPNGFFSAEEDSGWEDLELFVPKDSRRVFPNWWKHRPEQLSRVPEWQKEGDGFLPSCVRFVTEEDMYVRPLNE